MKRSPLVALLLAAACSSLGADGEPVAIEFLVPNPAVVDIGDTIQLRARVLDQNGDSLAATIRWRTSDSTVGVDSVTGRFWGIQGTTGNVQPLTGTLTGFRAAFQVRPAADTLIVDSASATLIVVTGDSVSPAITPRVAQADGTGLTGRTVIIRLVAPTGAAVRLTGDVVADTLTTTTGGVPSPTIRVRRFGVAPGDSAIVQVEARRPSGAVVPGSGQKIRVYFQ